MSTYDPSADSTLCAALCRHCGQVEEAHHSDARCYTTDELLARLRFTQRAWRWPQPDEGCGEEQTHG